MKMKLFLAAMVALSSTVGLNAPAQATNHWDASWDTGNWFSHRLKDVDCLDYGEYGVETIYSNGFAFQPRTCGGYVVDNAGRKVDIGPWRSTDYTYGAAPLYPPHWY